MRIPVLMLLPILAMAGCSAESHVAPVASVNASGGNGSREPESANSLPRGSAVNGPLTGAVGEVGPTRVGPATRAP